LANVIGESLSF